MATAITLALLGGVTRHGEAQQAPYANYLVGERALGLAGAFVALGDDPSAMFHNPAALSTLPTGAISGSLWAMSQRSRDMDRGLVSSISEEPFDYDDVSSLPLFVGGVAKVGTPDARGVRGHALGIALFSPYQDDFRYFVEAARADGSEVEQLNIWHEDESLWMGLGYAFRHSPELAFGVSLFYARRSIDHEEVELSSVDGVAPIGRSGIASVRGHRVVLRAGAMYAPARSWKLGLMAQLPSLRLSDTADVRTLEPRADATEDPAGAGVARSSGTRRANLPIPWELRAGGTYFPTSSTLLTADISLLGPAGSENLPVVEGAPELLFLPASSRQVLSVRAAAGVEWVVADSVPLRGGLVWEMPTTPKLPGSSPRYLPRHLQSFGVAMSVGFRSDEFDFSIGSTAIVSHGQALALARADGLEDATFVRTGAVDRTIFVYLAGGRSAVHLVADQVKPIVAPD